MTQQPYSRPGVVDFSTLKQPTAPESGALGGLSGTPAAGSGGGTGGGTGGTGVSGAYAAQIDEQNFSVLLDASRRAPVLLVFYSPTQVPESSGLARDIATLSEEFAGRFLAGLVDIDTAPQIAQAMQIPSVPLVVAVLDGRPMPLFQDIVPIEELRAALTQVMQQLAAQGVTSRHEPLSVAAGPADDGADPEAEPVLDPRYAPAQDALEAGDLDGAITEYETLIAANPADSEAAAGLSMAKVLKRTDGVDLIAAREAAAANPDDVDAQILVADLDLLGGHVEDAFTRLVDVVRRTRDDDRDKARSHLVELFGAVGNGDPRVTRGRQQLASALF